ncbi:MAG TPA: hypothetical protein VK578_00705 [Edaphobacter sp.]|nr:hypothetical protein [Edaphobacter sp.]
MNHLTEDELVEHYYGEAPADVEHHLHECDTCAEAYTVLRQDLASIKPSVVPMRDASYGDQVWQSLRSSLPAYEQQKKQKRHWLHFNLLQGLSYAAACIVLIAAAFLAGRQWEHRQHPNLQSAANNPSAQQPIILVVLGDHLDRSERLLVELNHANDTGAIMPVKAEAQDLLSANRLYRASATRAGDPQLTAALDRLERVLVEIVNEPEGSSPSQLARLQKEMNTDGLLFEVRVLRSRIPDQQKSSAVRTKGVSI